MTSLDAPIVGVTVYPGQARIVRRGELTLAAGRHLIELIGLPSNLEADSVRVIGIGAAAIGTVDVATTRNSEHLDSEQAGRLERELRELDDRVAEIDDTRRVLDARRESLTALGARAGRGLAKEVVRQGADPSRLDQIAEYVATRLDATYARGRELSARQRELQDERRRIERALADLAIADPDTTTIAVDLDAAGGEVALEVSYLVPGASWASRYDVRLDDERLRVDWFAMVTQRSGETWPAGQFKLSTARPGAAVTIPEPRPWYLHERPSGPIGRAAVMMAGAVPPAPGAADLTVAPAMVTREGAQVEHGLTATDYLVERAAPIPPDGSGHQVLIASFELPARVDRIAAPVQGADVVIRVAATNSTEHTLRPGRAALFHGPEFVGSTDLASWAPGEERDLALGLDDRIRLERKLIHRHAAKALVGGTRRYELGYRTEVTNHGPVATRMTVLDQVPVSTSADITVKDVRITPAPVTASGEAGRPGGEDGDLGLVRWELTLQPGERSELRLFFRVDTAKGVEPIGWRE